VVPRALPVDDYLRTNVGHIFAAGAVNGRSKLVQSARLEGRIAAWNAVHGPTRQPGHDVVPSGSFTDPEYGTVGMTENQAAGDHDIVVGIASYNDLVRPVADGHPDGFCSSPAGTATPFSAPTCWANTQPKPFKSSRLPCARA
jgi:pyruvate/2-oxoglutarate dehydrogenase complex dihydrolipoamide dehydrogenase (E3) component